MMNEKDLLLSIKAALSLKATNEILASLTQLAGVYIERGATQEGADVLAYLLRRDDLPDDIYNHAQDLWDDMARYICPRVLLDAEDFGEKAYLEDIIEYVFADSEAKPKSLL